MLGFLDRGDVAGQPAQGVAEGASRLAEHPPFVAICGPTVPVALDLHRVGQAPKDLWPKAPDIVLFQAVQVDHLHAARAGRQIAPVSIGPDRRRIDAIARQFVGLALRNDKARPVQFHARRTQECIRPQRLGGGHPAAYGQMGADIAPLFIELKDDIPACIRPLLADRKQASLAVRGAALGHSHGDTHLGAAFFALAPGMVRNGEGQPHGRLSGQMVLQHAAREILGDGVGGDEAEPPQLALGRRQDFSGAIPPRHDQIGRAEPPLPHMPQGVDIAVAQLATKVLARNEGRVADDEVGDRPLGRLGPAIVHDLRFPVEPPQTDRAAARIAMQIFARRHEQGVGPDDAVAPPSRGQLAGGGQLGRRLSVADAPLQVPDPHDDLGDRGGVVGFLNAPELGRVDLAAYRRVGRLASQLLQGAEDLAFQVLHHGHGDIEEVARSAGGVQHPDRA